MFSIHNLEKPGVRNAVVPTMKIACRLYCGQFQGDELIRKRRKNIERICNTNGVRRKVELYHPTDGQTRESGVKERKQIYKQKQSVIALEINTRKTMHIYKNSKLDENI